MTTTTATTTAADPVLDGWPGLGQILGHPATWPEAWHHTLTHHGTAALLAQAATDLATQPTTPAA